MNNPNNKVLSRFSIPYFVWLFLLAIIPTVVMLVLAFMSTEGLELNLSFTTDNLLMLTETSVIRAFTNSLLYSLIATILCAIVGYVIAYVVFCSKLKNKFIVLTIFLLPMWSNLLLRTNALKSLLQPNNIVINILRDVFNNPALQGLNLSGTSSAVIIGLVITYCPFMILSIYNALEKIDGSLQEASLDLGVTGNKKFWKVIFPLSAKGIFTGSILVFLPCASGFAVPNILGENKIVLIGNLIENSIIDMNYNFGSLLAIIIMFIILGVLFIFTKIDSKGETLI